jgi:hypothetical protein
MNPKRTLRVWQTVAICSLLTISFFVLSRFYEYDQLSKYEHGFTGIYVLDKKRLPDSVQRYFPAECKIALLPDKSYSADAIPFLYFNDHGNFSIGNWWGNEKDNDFAFMNGTLPVEHGIAIKEKDDCTLQFKTEQGIKLFFVKKKGLRNPVE